MTRVRTPRAPLHATQTFPGDPDWELPRIAPTPLPRLPDYLVPYGQRIRAARPPFPAAAPEGELVAAHFFSDDFRFEAVWNYPLRALQALRRYPVVLTPDFSLYRDAPLPVQLWNTYRARWCGCFWQAAGLAVLPTVSWAGAASHAFCFAGLPRHGVVAVSAVGAQRAEDAALFVAGFRELVRRIAPAAVLAYGPLPAACRALVPVATYPTRWSNIRAARRSVRRSEEA